MIRSLSILALLIATAYLGLCAWLYLTQRSQIYFPVPEVNPPGAQSIRLAGGDATLKIWVVERPGPRALIYFGGNAEDVSANLPALASALPGYSLYLVNYRGYGGSTGRPSESALVADARTRLRPLANAIHGDFGDGPESRNGRCRAARRKP